MSIFTLNADIDVLSNSIIEFLNKECNCENERFINDNSTEVDIENIFEEINRLSDKNDERTVEEILYEAELLIKNQQNVRQYHNKQFKNCNDNLGRIYFENNVDKCLTERNDFIRIETNEIEKITEGIETIHFHTEQKETGIKEMIYSNPFEHKLTENEIRLVEPYVLLNKKVVRRIKKQNNISRHPNTTQSAYSAQNFLTNCSLLISKISLENVSTRREYSLKAEIDQLQEKLKGTEECLQILKVKHETLSKVHQDLLDNHSEIEQKSNFLKLDVQNLTDFADLLKMELDAVKKDRNDILEIQNTLRRELDQTKSQRKNLLEKSLKDEKVINDLQRQCKEMETVLIKKDSEFLSPLIVGSNISSIEKDHSTNSRRLLEQRIAQLETDAKQQDMKAQKILANVQAKFNSVQAKYETHIADLETQVLSLQEINTKLNKKIEFQITTLNNYEKPDKKFQSSSTQTDYFAEREVKLITISTQTETKSFLKYTSAPVSKKTTSKCTPPNSEINTTGYNPLNKEDMHLLATIRGMRVDLAIKNKAIQRITKELDECKRTIRKLQKEKDGIRSENIHESCKHYESYQYSDRQNSFELQTLKEAQNKIKLLEFDYKSLHKKRLQDLKALQSVHEREHASCHETVRILQQRLSDKDETIVNQKRRKIPIDFYALKAKVTSLEHRHSEREQRLHLLVEALSQGRLNGALKEVLTENDI